ncbi:hypothetical protein M413DRAFT_449771 [Hebeloma cylindrosporum]|uniref:Uncharacterized protein n=1 Tax=Hebeloma cylindrosporum TaxID=76867 RepID=A0A0C3BF37_HEBCY|nr:hypothetical protein M413DRAFT_449771 [Hebeloma cylindrosporum h7]
MTHHQYNTGRRQGEYPPRHPDNYPTNYLQPGSYHPGQFGSSSGAVGNPQNIQHVRREQGSQLSIHGYPPASFCHPNGTYTERSREERHLSQDTPAELPVIPGVTALPLRSSYGSYLTGANRSITPPPVPSTILVSSPGPPNPYNDNYTMGAPGTLNAVPWWPYWHNTTRTPPPRTPSPTLRVPDTRSRAASFSGTPYYHGQFSSGQNAPQVQSSHHWSGALHPGYPQYSVGGRRHSFQVAYEVTETEVVPVPTGNPYETGWRRTTVLAAHGLVTESFPY